MTLRQSADRDGFAVARGLLSADEVARLRRACGEFFRDHGQETNLGKFQPNAATVIPDLEWVVTHPGILAAMRELIGCRDIVFTGNADAQLSRLSGWHKDDGDSRYFTPDCYRRDDCRVFRAGIYLQDHDGGHQGMTVRVGSHRTASLSEGEVAYVPTRVCDVMFIDVRLTHAGQLPDLAERMIWQAASLAGRDVLGRRAKDLYWRLIGRPPKMSVFFGFGFPNRFTDDFTQATMGCHFGPSAAPRLPLPPTLIAALRREGVRLPDCMCPGTPPDHPGAIQRQQIQRQDKGQGP